MAAASAIVLSSWLEKSPPLNKAMSSLKGFKRRFFVLRHNSTNIEYYAAQGDESQLKGVIDMQTVVSVNGNEKWPGGHADKHPWVFAIEVLSGRVYYLSAETEALMNDWVWNLNETFKFFLRTNNGQVRRASSSALLPDIILVHTNLVGVRKPFISLPGTETTTAAEVVKTSLGAISMPLTEAPNYVLANVNKDKETAETVKPTDFPLKVLCADAFAKLYLVHKDEAKFVLKLIQQVEDQHKDKKDKMWDLRYLGSLALPVSRDLDRPPSIQQVSQGIEQMKKRGQVRDAEVHVVVDLDGIKVLTATGNPRKPYGVMAQHSLYTITSCLDLDRVFGYLVSPPMKDRELPVLEYKAYLFKCADRKEALAIRDQLQQSCNKLFVLLHNAEPKAMEGDDEDEMEVNSPVGLSPEKRTASLSMKKAFVSVPGEDLSPLLRKAEMAGAPLPSAPSDDESDDEGGH
eukprot:m.83921 g.83921  ORF g.83921 m.83921 type:complete len:460 (-) comp14995_c0_seq1:282-1661(-)